MTNEQLTERLQKLWVQAANSCGAATAQVVEEIQELERLLRDRENASSEKPLDNTASRAR